MSNTDFTKITYKIQRSLNDICKKYPLIKSIVLKINEKGGRALLVGGAVRDLLLGLPIKDVDIEVHGLSLDILESLLKNYGAVRVVGKSFGVLKLDGLDADWSLPRTDTAGRKPTVTIDPYMAIKDAFARRDLTINAMGIDLMTQELIDPFNGQADLENRILRTPDPMFFVQDPLRFYRVMQFIGRFAMQPDDILNAICAAMDVSGVSKERIEQEFKKLFLKSSRPSLGLRWLHQIKRIALFPELAVLIGIPQDPIWHPEGDVFEHTMQTIDAAAQLPIVSQEERLILIYAALCHDLGKVSTTCMIDGRLKSRGHDVVGVTLAQELLHRIMQNQIIIATVKKLVRYHMAPGQLVTQHAGLSAYKRLALRLAPETNLQMLGYLAYADKRGRNGVGHEPLSKHIRLVEVFFERATLAAVLTSKEQPILKEADVADIVQPGPQMGVFLRLAYKLQIEHGIKDKDQLKKIVLTTLNE